MIFAVEGHIGMIRNGLFWYEDIDKPDWSAKGMKEYHTYRAQFLADRLDISKEVKDGLHPLLIKTESRRLSRGIYQIEAERKNPHKIGYAVQLKRGVKAEPDIRIVMDNIWSERCMYPAYPEVIIQIFGMHAWAEGGYTPEEYEKVFRDINPKWDGQKRWAFKFHAIKVQT